LTCSETSFKIPILRSSCSRTTLQNLGEVDKVEDTVDETKDERQGADELVGLDAEGAGQVLDGADNGQDGLEEGPQEALDLVDLVGEGGLDGGRNILDDGGDGDLELGDDVVDGLDGDEDLLDVGLLEALDGVGGAGGGDLGDGAGGLGDGGDDGGEVALDAGDDLVDVAGDLGGRDCCVLDLLQSTEFQRNGNIPMSSTWVLTVVSSFWTVLTKVEMTITSRSSTAAGVGAARAREAQARTAENFIVAAGVLGR
jgi:hypothetical protein